MNLEHITQDVIIDSDRSDKTFSPLLSEIDFNSKVDYESNVYDVVSCHVEVCNLNGSYYDAVLITFTEHSEDTQVTTFDILISQFGNYISNTSLVDNYN